MKTRLAVLAVAASMLLASTQAGATAYDTRYVANPSNAASAWLSGTGDIGASLGQGDSLTVTVVAPAGLAFETGGGAMFDYQVLSGGTGKTEDVSYAFYDGNSVLASGTVVGVDFCCSDVRLPLYTTPTGTWDRLVYTATLTYAAFPTTIENEFIYTHGGARYVTAVPEASDAAMLLAGLGLLAAVARRRRAG